MPLNIIPSGNGIPSGEREEWILREVRGMFNADPDRISIGKLDETGSELFVDSERFGFYVDGKFQTNIIRIPDINQILGAYFDLESLQIEIRERLKGLKMDDVELR
jgi:hypothetical protein